MNRSEATSITVSREHDRLDMNVRPRVVQRLMRIVALSVLGLVLLSGRAIAGQSLSQDASVIGQVTDEQGGVLPGVTATATSPALQLPSVVSVTDTRGEYRLTPLPIGVYVIEYSLPGFQTVRREGVRLTAGFTAKIDISLKVGGLQETITVSGAAPQVDVTATNTSTQLTREILDLIPTNRYSFVAVLSQAAGTRQPAESGALIVNPAFKAFGLIGQPWQLVDGVVTKNFQSGHESANYFDFSIFEEATVSTLGHDASVPNRGVNINTVIRSGGNSFHGRLFYAATGENLQEKALLGGLSTKFKDDLMGDLGGRIVRDKLWFWVGARHTRLTQESPDCHMPDGSLCEPSQIRRYLTPKGVFQLNQSNRLTGFWSMLWSPVLTNMDRIRPYGSRREIYFRHYVTKGEWQYVKGNALVLTANVGKFRGLSKSVCPGAGWGWVGSRDGCDFPSATRDLITGMQGGLGTNAGERLEDARLGVRTNLSYYKTNWLYGNHEIKVGFDYYYAPTRRSNSGRGDKAIYVLRFRSGVADSIEIWNAPTFPTVAQRYYGTYFADSWTVGRRLTLNLGIRHAYDAGYENASCRDAAPPPANVAYPTECFPEIRLPVYNTVVPRLRAAYDVTGDGRTTIKGGWGRYMAMRASEHVQIASRTATGATIYRWRDLNLNREYDVGETNLDPNGPDFLDSYAGGTSNATLQSGIVNPNETDPYTDEYSIQFERQLGQDYAVRLTGLQTRVLNVHRLTNPLRPYEAFNIPITNLDPGPDGILGNTDDTGKTITYYDYPASLRGRAFQQVMIVNGPEANERHNSIEVALTKRMSNNWQLSGSYSATKKHIPLMPSVGGSANNLFSVEDPNSGIFAADNTWEWEARVSGSYLFRYGILVSGNLAHQSGEAYARTALFRGGVQIPTITLRVEPFGSRRLPNTNLLDFHAEKRLRVRQGQELQLGVNVFNALNSTAATTITAQSGSNFGLITARVMPRIVEFQMRYTY